MKLICVSALKRIFGEEDCKETLLGKCLQNESFAFQVFVVAEEEISGASVSVKGKLKASVYEVKKMKGDLYGENPDDYYERATDDMYPELLQKVKKLSLQKGESATLFVEIPADEKKAGVYTLQVCVGDKSVEFTLEVLKKKLAPTDMMITHWFHMDGIADYYGVKPFSKEFYTLFESFLSAYAKMGNTMILVPLFTPPLDTEFSRERTTAQLVGVSKKNGRYRFDFSKLKEYIDICKKQGIRYFELSHLFSQWGGQYCPKIMVKEKGKLVNAFGWNKSSESTEYKRFLRAFLPKLCAFLRREGIFDDCVMHLTDEPSENHIQRYCRLSKFVRRLNQGMRLFDALSEYSFYQTGAVDLPVVCTASKDIPLFDGAEKLVYYCVGVDRNYLSNRYFHMPLHRTVILGAQLYEQGVQGFLQWGYNFYNARLSRKKINPYENTTADGGFFAGDSFIVYPGKEGVEYSLRYFAMLKAFEDYRLLKTVENKKGKEFALQILKENGISGWHEYPRSLSAYDSLRESLYQAL